MEEKIAYLQMIQGVISRMGSNSFAVKGWSITLTAAIFALAASQGANKVLLWVPYFPVVMFWLLDAFFLRQEKLFRKLYDAVRAKQDTSPIDFSMETADFRTEVNSLICIALSKTLLPFHGGIVLIVVVVQSITNGWF